MVKYKLKKFRFPNFQMKNYLGNPFDIQDKSKDKAFDIKPKHKPFRSRHKGSFKLKRDPRNWR